MRDFLLPENTLPYLDGVKLLYVPDVSTWLAAMAEHDSVRHLQGGITVSDELTAAYCRGQLTFRAMQVVPIEEHPHLARSANFWLPVQSYYAIHSTGLAVMMALNMTPPQDLLTGVKFSGNCMR